MIVDGTSSDCPSSRTTPVPSVGFLPARPPAPWGSSLVYGGGHAQGGSRDVSCGHTFVHEFLPVVLVSLVFRRRLGCRGWSSVWVWGLPPPVRARPSPLDPPAHDSGSRLGAGCFKVLCLSPWGFGVDSRSRRCRLSMGCQEGVGTGFDVCPCVCAFPVRDPRVAPAGATPGSAVAAKEGLPAHEGRREDVFATSPAPPPPPSPSCLVGRVGGGAGIEVRENGVESPKVEG